MPAARQDLGLIPKGNKERASRTQSAGVDRGSGLRPEGGIKTETERGEGCEADHSPAHAPGRGRIVITRDWIENNKKYPLRELGRRGKGYQEEVVRVVYSSNSATEVLP